MCCPMKITEEYSQWEILRELFMCCCLTQRSLTIHAFLQWAQHPSLPDVWKRLFQCIYRLGYSPHLYFSRDAWRTNDRSSTQRITSVRKLCRKVPMDKILLINTYYKKTCSVETFLVYAQRYSTSARENNTAVLVHASMYQGAIS